MVGFAVEIENVGHVVSRGLADSISDRRKKSVTGRKTDGGAA